MLEYKTVVSEDGKEIFIDVQGRTIINEFLFGEIGLMHHFVESIDSVLSGTQNEDEMTGNLCTLKIDAENTKIINNFVGDGELNEDVVSTRDLRHLIECWLKEYNDFHSA